MVTALARWHYDCAEISDEISWFTISSGELWSVLFVPQRMKMQYKVEFEGHFRGFFLHNKFWYLFLGIPKFNVLCLEKYLDQTSGYLIMFGIKESWINKIFECESFSKKFWFVTKFVITFGYSTYMFGFEDTFTFFLRTVVPDIANNLPSIEETLSLRFISAITGGKICSDTERALFALPVNSTA